MLLSYSSKPILRRPDKDDMMTKLLVRHVKYDGVEALAFYFHEIRETTMLNQDEEIPPMVNIQHNISY